MLHLLRSAVAALRRRPAFTGLALGGIALALGLVLTVAALLDAAFGAHPPSADPARSLGLYKLVFRNPDYGSTTSTPAGMRFVDLTLRGLPGVETVALAQTQGRRATFQTGARVDLWFKRADAAFWKVTRFRFLEGAPFTEADDRAGQRVAVVGKTLADRVFGGRAMGKTLRVGTEGYRVVGVVEDVPFLQLFPFADVWVPLGTVSTPAFRRALHGDLLAVATLAPGARRADVEAAFQDRLGRVPVREVNDSKTVTARLGTPLDAVVESFFGGDDAASREAVLFYVLLGLFGVLFLTIPALNLVNLNLSRTLERATEIGVRKAFGARPRALSVQFLVEYALLCVVGAALGLGVAYALLSLIAAAEFAPYVRFTPNLTLLATALGAALVLSLMSGVYPAWKMAHLRPADALGRR